MKILWIDLNSSYAHASLALPALHAQTMHDTAVRWAVVSSTINENTGVTVAQAAAHNPDIIAATAWLFNREALLHITARLKALLPHTRIILGGPEFLGDNREFLRSTPWVDCVFRGEGEEQFPRWLSVWDTPAQWSDIPGLCYTDPHGNYTDNGTARVQSFHTLVPPEQSPLFNWDKPFVQLETTRGCFNTCAFCVSGGEKPVRALPVAEIRNRIQHIHDKGIRDIRVLDRTFNYNARRAQELLAIFRDYTGMRFHLEIHPALLTAGLRTGLAAMPAGALHLEAGIQSLHQDVLQQSSRAGDMQASLDGLRFLCALPNMETHADLIAGLPLYRLEQIFDDVHTLMQYGAGEIQLESLKVLPGTEMRRRAAEWGIAYSPLPPYEVLATPHISPDGLQRARHLSRLLDAYHNTGAWQHITRTLALAEPGFLTRFLDHLITQDVIDKPMSIEKRGLILYDFCRENYPAYATQVSIAWIRAGLSLKKEPTATVRTRHLTPPDSWKPLYGHYREGIRLALLPDGDTARWFGFDPGNRIHTPVFEAESELSFN